MSVRRALLQLHGRLCAQPRAAFSAGPIHYPSGKFNVVPPISFWSSKLPQTKEYIFNRHTPTGSIIERFGVINASNECFLISC
jgi:hypothetical protein